MSSLVRVVLSVLLVVTVEGRGHEDSHLSKEHGPEDPLDGVPSGMEDIAPYRHSKAPEDASKYKPYYENSRNATVDYSHYSPGKENATKEGEWNIEKQEKPLEVSKEVLETQHATCQVTTEELVATAQATVTRVMKGLCNAKEMDKRFRHMEELLETELTVLKNMLINIEDRLGDQTEMISKGHNQLASTVSKKCEDSSEGKFGWSARMRERLEQSENEHSGEDSAGTRDSEISKYNSSIHVETTMNGHSKKVFTYYWKIREMLYKLTGWSPRRSLRSQSFYVFPSGYRMYLKIYPRQNEENFFIHVGVTKGEFDDSLSWPFPLKHRVHILDQTKEGRTFEDIASRIWDPTQLCSEFNWQRPTKGDNYECVGLGFPHDVLRQREYIRGDTVVIKLTVYLE